MADQPKVTAYLLDDHEVVRRGVRRTLEDSGLVEVVGESSAAEAAVGQILELQPDVAVLDGRLGDGSGIEVCRAVRSTHPLQKAIILTSYDENEAVLSAAMAGADGYVLKDVRAADLVETVVRVAGGEAIDPALTRRVLDDMRTRSQQAGHPSTLTDQELALLGLIAEGLTNRQISRRMFLSEKTVGNYVSLLLGKLGLQRRTQVAVLGAKLLEGPGPAPTQ